MLQVIRCSNCRSENIKIVSITYFANDQGIIDIYGSSKKVEYNYICRKCYEEFSLPNEETFFSEVKLVS